MPVLRRGGDGQLGWRGRRWEITNALRRQLIGIQMADEHRALVWFGRNPLRELDLRTRTNTWLPLGPIGSLQP